MIEIGDVVNVTKQILCDFGSALTEPHVITARVINVHPTGQIDVEYDDGKREAFPPGTESVRLKSKYESPGRIFTDLDHRLSHIPRWQIAHTHQHQSVAEHTFNVHRMAMRIARLWFGLKDPDILLAISDHAATHDDFEALSGDPPTMVKPYFDETAFEHDHRDLIKVPVLPANGIIRDVVKLADLLDGYHFLCVEATLGNTYLSEHFEHEPGRILRWISEKGYNRIITNLAEREMIAMTHDKSQRHSRRGR